MYSAASGFYAPESLPAAYPSHDAFFDDPSTQMALSQAARASSRGDRGHYRAGSAMRVMKPGSANNSPRSPQTLNWRMMPTDGMLHRGQQQAMENLQLYQGTQPVDAPLSERPASRPFSWHPASVLQQAAQAQLQQAASFPPPAPALYLDGQELFPVQSQLSPLVPSYSNDTSPCSTFSPLPLLHRPDENQLLQLGVWDPYGDANALFPLDENQNLPETWPATAVDGSLSRAPANFGALDWNAFVSRGFNDTSPPTPESFPQSQHPLPAVSESATSYPLLDEPQEEGEILIGMGLYDTPEKLEADPQLDTYRSAVSSLLGSPFRNSEPRGRGLKLEETWEPPKSEDDEEEDDGDESEYGQD